MRRELKEDRTDRETANEQMFGPWLQGLFVLRYLLHAVSFAFGVGYFYGAATGQAEVFGIDLTGNTFKATVLVSVLGGLVLEWVHGTFPPLCYHLALNPRETLRSWDRRVLFLLSVVVVAGITWFSAKTSEGGGDQTGKRFYTEPIKTDLSGVESSYAKDSLRIASAAEDQATAVVAIYKGKADSVESTFGAKIRYASKQVRLWKIRAQNEGPQAQIEVRAWQSKERAIKSEAKAAKRDQINIGASKAAAVRLSSSEKLEGYATTLSNTKAEAAASYKTAKEKALAENDALRDFLSGAGFWVVIAILVTGFIDTYLAQICGYKPPGFSFSYPRRVARFKKAIAAIFGDKIDHSIVRLEATQKNLKHRDEAKPFAWPSGRFMLIGSALVAFAFFIVQTAVYSEADHAQASVVPFPYNWVGLTVCVLVLGVTIKREANKRVGKDEPVPEDNDTDDTGTEDVSGDSEKDAETCVPQDDEADTDSGEIQMTNDEITLLKKYCRTNYGRIHTAPTQGGRDSARSKFKTSKASLRAIGIKVSTSSKMIQKQVKIDKQLVSVSYRELIISK